jgi:hypothetical protein
MHLLILNIYEAGSGAKAFVDKPWVPASAAQVKQDSPKVRRTAMLPTDQQQSLKATPAQQSNH